MSCYHQKTMWNFHKRKTEKKVNAKFYKYIESFGLCFPVVKKYVAFNVKFCFFFILQNINRKCIKL